MSDSRLAGWLDRCCDRDPAGRNGTNVDHIKTDGKTPLCDMLVARGVLPNRSTRSLAKASMRDTTARCQGLSRRGLHAVLSVLPQSTVIEEVPKFIPSTCDQHAHASASMWKATKANNTVDWKPYRYSDWSGIARVSGGREVKVAGGRHRSLTSQYLASDGFSQYLSFLENSRMVLLACSKTLAAYSSDITKKSKHEYEAQEKEFIEYFGVV
ncbi:hypothetical protein H2200_003478 [Cladophialophora chaetospira]|uniref:Uncharacterized protein n=1 Tax=Cladophialophora chaetospira TaxID=386627 RepID=A0AA39CMR2_9EURO|nr:hypothetical protein H2200_003478 [Cladophialophora chaetospira]